MKQTIKCALIGAGRIGRIHANNLGLLGVELTQVFDTNESAALAVAQLTGARSVSLAEIWSSNIDAVIIASPTNTHADLIERAAQAGKAIFCEKPIDLTLKRVASCLKAIQQKVILQIGFNRRFDPNFIALKKAIVAGSIGEVQSLHILSRDPQPPSKEYLLNSGGLFKDMMIHDFDTARWLMGEEMHSMVAQATQRSADFREVGDWDSAMVSFKTNSGVLGHITNHRETAFGYDQRIEVFGTKGKLIADNVLPTTVKLVNRAGTIYEKPHHFFIERYKEAYLEEMRSFFEAVNNHTSPLVSGLDGYMALKLAQLAEQSVRTGLTVFVSEQQSSVVAQKQAELI